MRTLITIGFIFIFTFCHCQVSENINFQHDGKTVYGIFEKPSHIGKFPTVVINPGSGSVDRDGTVVLEGENASCLFPVLIGDTLKPYKDLAKCLVDSGYAVLRYDKLEYTYPYTLGEVTFHKLWLPVESALDYLKQRADVDTNQMILIGHSEGSSMIPYIAKNSLNVQALISIAGPRTPLDSLLAYQLVTFADSCNGNVALAQFQANQITEYFDIIRSNTWNSNTPSLFGVPASEWYKYILVVDSVSINYNIAEKKTFFISFGMDANVPLTEFHRFQSEVFITEDFLIIPDYIHYITPYNFPHPTNSITDTIISWLKRNLIVANKVMPSKLDLNIHIFSNPVNRSLILEHEGHFKAPLEYIITDLLGNIISRGTISKFPIGIDISRLDNAVYVIKVVSNNYSRSFKFLKV